MYIEYSKSFLKSFKRAPHSIRKNFLERLNLFNTNPTHPFLHNHALKGKYASYRSININGDWRAVYKVQEDNKGVYFIEIGSHSQLYG